MRAGAEQDSVGGEREIWRTWVYHLALHTRWLVVKDSFLLYMRPETGTVSFVQLFDPGFEVQVGKRSTETRYGVRIDTSHR